MIDVIFSVDTTSTTSPMPLAMYPSARARIYRKPVQAAEMSMAAALLAPSRA